MDGECRCETGCPHRHRLERAKSRWKRDHPLAIESCVLGVTAIMDFRQSAPGDENMITDLMARVARRLDDSRKIDTADERVLSENLSCARRSERIFVVDVRIQNANDDITRGQIVDRQLIESRDDFFVDLVDA